MTEKLISDGLVLLDLDADGVGHLRLNRPEASNGMNVPFLRALHDAVMAAHGEPRLRVLLLTGEGPNFCAGGDVKTFASKGDGLPDYLREATAWLQTCVQGLLALQVPVIASVHGYAAGGGGFGLVCASDIVVAGESAKFLSGATRVGMAPDAGVSVTLPLLVGLRKALDIIMTNPVLTAAEALDIGLITRVVPDDELAAQSLTLAQSLAPARPGRWAQPSGWSGRASVPGSRPSCRRRRAPWPSYPAPRTHWRAWPPSSNGAHPPSAAVSVGLMTLAASAELYQAVREQRLDDFVARLVERFREEIPEYSAVPRADQRTVREQCSALLTNLPAGRPPDAEELRRAEVTARRRAEQGIPVQHVIGSFHISFQLIWQLLQEESDPLGAKLPGSSRPSGRPGSGAASCRPPWPTPTPRVTASRQAATAAMRQRLLMALRETGEDHEQAEQLARELGFDLGGDFQTWCALADDWPPDRLSALQEALTRRCAPPCAGSGARLRPAPDFG